MVFYLVKYDLSLYYYKSVIDFILFIAVLTQSFLNGDSSFIKLTCLESILFINYLTESLLSLSLTNLIPDENESMLLF